MTSLRRSLSPSVYDRSLQNGVFEQLSTSLPSASYADPSSAPNEKNTYWPFCIWLRFFERKDISHDRSKSKGSIWKKPFLPVMLCFFLGFSAGLMPGVTTANLLSTESPSKVICLSQVSLNLVIYCIYVVISL